MTPSRQRVRPTSSWPERARTLVLAAAAAAACHGGAVREPVNERGSASTSNVLRSDYVGSAACRTCHPSQYDAVWNSPMHRMTRDLRATTTHAKFAGETLDLGGDHARLVTVDGERRLELEKGSGERRSFRVTKVIGGRYREDFVGIELDTSAPAGTRGQEQVLPLSHLIFDGGLRYKGYSVLVTERPGLEPGQVWRETCIFCHNTPPAFDALFDELHGPGHPSYQGSASDDAPADRKFRYTVTDPSALDEHLRRELEVLGAPPRRETGTALLARAMGETKARFDEQNLVELGIGCEACHGGSRQHAENPRAARPSFTVQSTFFRVENADGSALTPALAQNRTCAKCHTVLFSRYPYTWEGGRRRQDPGGSPINSGEGRDFLLGGCRNQLACTRCHDPHREDPRAALEQLGEARGDALCTSCHAKFASPSDARAHTHHELGGPGSHCLDCHMPKKNMGLAYQLTRYHRIGSPTDPARVEGDRPLECALCHADKSVEQIVSTMERWYEKRYDRDKLQKLYGHDLRIDAIRATLIGGLPHEQAVAAAVAAQSGRRDLAALVADVMRNDYPLVRYFAKHALTQLTGQPPPIDPGASSPEIERALKDWASARPAN